MTLIHDYIQWFSLLIVLTGWYTYTLGLLGHLTMVKKRRIGHKWLWTNRRNKVQRSIISSCLFGLFLYVHQDPESMNLAVDDERKEFALYLLYQFLIGGSSFFLFDYVMDGVAKTRGIDMSKRPEYDDDGATIITRPKDAE